MVGSRVVGRPSNSASGPRTQTPESGHLRSQPRTSGPCVTPRGFSSPFCDMNITGYHIPGVTVRSQKPVHAKRWGQAPRKHSGNVASLGWTAKACTPDLGSTRRGVSAHPGLQKQTPHRPTRPPGRLGQHQGTRGSCYLSLSSKGLAPPRRQRRWRPDSASSVPWCPVGPLGGPVSPAAVLYLA